MKYSLRDGWLYDLMNQTTEFTEKTYIKSFLDFEFEDLPEYAAQVIALRVAAETYRNDIGADSNYQLISGDADSVYEASDA